MKIVLVTGGFDPVHSGHISYLNHAEHLGDQLIVGLNSDAWLARKKGRAFMPWRERMIVLDNLHMVDRVIEFDDSDGTACDAIRKVKKMFPDDDIIFANGGDRTQDNIPEMVFDDVEFVFGVGGEDKKNSSSWILEEWKKPRTDRAWGYYRVLHEVGSHVKLKELTVNPKTCLSMQRHEKRAEFWFVAEGEATVYTVDPYSTDHDLMASPARHQSTWIKLNEWHQLCNETDEPLKLIEIQYGEDCVEEDIERR
jgi:D-beta-D-heptose 7-phosphate kinase/D-beta-D-heptose 1-phosphate adenosyltransferase